MTLSVPAKRIAIVLLGSVLAITAVACGGSDRTASNDQSINGITVPPDPGANGNSSVSGVDTDANGIRDDIDRFLASRYGSDPVELSASRVSAHALQRVLTVDAQNHSEAVAAAENDARAGMCAGEEFQSAGADAARELDEVFLRTVNTRERIEQYKAVAANVGQFVGETDVTCQR